MYSALIRLRRWGEVVVVAIIQRMLRCLLFVVCKIHLVLVFFLKLLWLYFNFFATKAPRHQRFTKFVTGIKLSDLNVFSSYKVEEMG